MNAINRNHSGTMTLMIEPDTFKRLFHAAEFRPGYQAVLSVNRGSLEDLKKLPRGQLVEFSVGDGNNAYSRQYRIKRLDYKHGKLYLEAA